MTRLLLCTDLDRTLLPNGPQPESRLARERFQLLADKDEVILVYVTGRDRSLVQQAIKNYQIPRPDFVVGDVGSTIYQLDNEGWHYWQAWEDEIAHDWNGKSHDDLHNLLKGFRDLRMQEISKQNTHKLSYYVPLYIDYSVLVASIKDTLEKEKVYSNIIWSIDEPANIGLLDILPQCASKKHAIEFLMQQLQFDYNETVFAGDSGNDISVMASPIHSVLVANASDDVRKLAKRCAAMNGQIETVYFARGDYLGMNGNYSAGILEGVVHYMPAIEKWLELSDD